MVCAAWLGTNSMTYDHTEGHLTISIAADYGAGSRVRRSARTWLDAQDVTPEDRDDILLVLSELFANAVRASDGFSEVDVSLSRGSGSVVVEVVNSGQAFELDTVRLPTPDRAGGRGLAIAAALGTLQVHRRDRHTVVECLLHLH